MSYFPKHYITPNQYTPGGEYMYKSSQIEYIGWYWKTGNGRTYTGKTPQSSEIIELAPIITVDPGFFTSTPSYTEKIRIATPGEAPLDYGSGLNIPIQENIIIDYASIKKVPTVPKAFKHIPQYNSPTPTQQDYQNGEFRRYFAKKTNELLYIEINLETYELLRQKSPTIEWTLYLAFNIPWQLTGDKQQVYDVNRNITLLAMKNNKLYKFDEYLKFDFTKYYQ